MTLTRNILKAPYFVVFDVESVGLYGEAFAVGAVVVDRKGAEQETYLCSFPPETARGRQSDHQWVKESVPDLSRQADFGSIGSEWNLQASFLEFWRSWCLREALLCADVPYPVEAGFLLRYLATETAQHQHQGIYPLLDVASILFAAGTDPVAYHERRANELPRHHPVCDARQSARLLIEALDRILLKPAPVPEELW